MSQSRTKVVFLGLFFIFALLLASVATLPSTATTVVQLEPSTVSSGDLIRLTANIAKNQSTVQLSYYLDANKNGKDDDGGSWVKIANVTDGGANDVLNATGYIGFNWMTPQLSSGQYILKVDDPNGPSRTTLFTVKNAPLHIVPTIYGPSTSSDKGRVIPGNGFSVVAAVTGNCRICHTTDHPTRDNPGVNTTATDKLFSADLSQITGNPGDTSVPPLQIHHQQVNWYNNAGKALADNETVQATVTGTNTAGNITTKATAYAGVNKVLSIPPTESSNGTPLTTAVQNNTTSAQSSAASQKSQSNPLPGFEAVFAIVGLTAVAYLLSRRR